MLKVTANKRIYGFIVASLLAGCQSPGGGPSPYRIPSGSTLTLNHALDIPTEKAHVSFQHGNLVGGVDNTSVSCRFEVKDLGPHTVEADTFTVTRAENPQEWISRPNTMQFSKVLYLESEKQSGVIALDCHYWDGPLWGRNITIAEVREATGNYFTLELAAPR